MRELLRLHLCVLAALACASLVHAQQERAGPRCRRHSPLKQIDTLNVGRPGLTWTCVLGGGRGNQAATPLVWNNSSTGSPTGASFSRSTP